MSVAREPLRERMRGRWHGVLPLLGVPAGFLNGKHQPCPICGQGKDRFRFDDKNSTGTWICSQCGAGDGIQLVMRLNGWDFKTAAQRIEAVCGDVQPRAPKPAADHGQQLNAMRKVWRSATPIGEIVLRYLIARGIARPIARDLRQSGTEMLALVRDPAGNGCQVHRTLLTRDGKKADGNCRLFMPGPIPKGSAVRLMPHQSEIGIAEGIETALSAATLFGMPCWAALNATMLKQWEVPPDVERVVVFGDNDANCTGQAAAYELARRLSSTVSVSVELPKETGSDWNDVLRARDGHTGVFDPVTGLPPAKQKNE